MSEKQKMLAGELYRPDEEIALDAAAAADWMARYNAASTLPAAEQAVSAGVVALSIVLLPIQLLGYLGLLYPGSTAVAEGALALAVLFWAGPRRASLPLGNWWRAGRRALASPASLALTGVSTALLAYLVAYVILVPSWGWDALTYHDTIIGYAFQNHGLQWIDTFDGLATLVNGYPRNVAQCEALERLLARIGQPLDIAVKLKVPSELIVDRIAGRAAAEGRKDDTPETVRERLRVYAEQTAPVAEHFGTIGRLRIVDGVGDVDAVFKRILAALPGELTGA